MAIKYQKDSRGIVWLTFDMPNRSTNVINDAFIDAFEVALERANSEPDLLGLVLTSAKRDFVVGADIDMLAQHRSVEDSYQRARRFKGLLRSMETMGKPVVAALNGSALGGGYEVALACHHRIAVADKRARFGLPEVKLGLLPGAGGTQRLPRMIGIQAALEIMTEGQSFDPERAQDMGLIDALVVDIDTLRENAAYWVTDNPRAGQPWDQRKFRWPGGDGRHPEVVRMFAVAPAMLNAKTNGHYRAPRSILAAVYEGSMVDFDSALQIETQYFTRLASGSESHNMIEVFWYQLNAIRKGLNRPQSPTQSFSKVGILGAGMMGSGIAYVTAKSSIEVVLKDVTKDAAESGKDRIRALLKKAVSRGRQSRADADSILNRIITSDQPSDLAGCELVIEAVFENRDLKAKVTQEAESIVENAIMASNTSTLPITGLAQASRTPDRFIGLHFFSPVHKMPLVEIIVGEKTSDQTLAAAFDFVRQLQMTPIVVNDSRGFYTSRVFSTYVLEGIAMLGEGQTAQRIESAGLRAGMPVGPLAVSDEVSLSLMHHIMQQTERDASEQGKPIDPHPADPLIIAMVERWDRPGRKAGRGFYDYPSKGPKTLWPDLERHFPPAPNRLDIDDMAERLAFIQAIESVRCLEENVVTRVEDANIGSIFGWGFAPFKGGTLQFINDYGLPRFHARAQHLAQRFGSRFSPPRLLADMAQDGTTFTRGGQQ